MNKQWITILCLGFLLASGINSRAAPTPIRLSDLFKQQSIFLFKPEYISVYPPDLHDTIRISFELINDLGKDTTIVYKESLNEWIQFTGIPTSGNVPAIRKISGRNFYGKIPYDYIYYPAQSIRIDSGTTYRCEIKYKGPTYSPAYKYIYLLTPQEYQSNIVLQKRFENTNFSITYFFIGAIAFGFFFFFFLFFKSRYKIFGWYSLFLFLQAAYGFIQIDVYTRLGHFLLTRFNWDDYVNEFLAFTAQAVYVQFIIYWLDIKSTNRLVYKVFSAISIFFLGYALCILLFYSIDSHNILIGRLESGIRMIIFLFQLVVFYLLIFKIKSPVRSYVITGSVLMTLFGVVLVYLNIKGVFDQGIFSDFDNGSWYMIGVLAESICFAMGLGLRYFQINQENIQLHDENVKALQDKLSTEQEARENERMLAEVNQELTNQQLTALRAQMNPHFIFNALNSIQKYILTGNVDEANSYLSKFSKLQRMILSYCDENFITLDKEINMLQLYLELEQLRLTDDFTFTITIDDDIEPEEMQIPPMMLQPFAENAIWHGLLPKEGEKKLSISFALSKSDELKCIVEDNGIGRGASKKIQADKTADLTTHKSKGLSLVYNRLAILERKYGKEFSVRFIDKMDENQKATGTIVELKIPLED